VGYGGSLRRTPDCAGPFISLCRFLDGTFVLLSPVSGLVKSEFKLFSKYFLSLKDVLCRAFFKGRTLSRYFIYNGARILMISGISQARFRHWIYSKGRTLSGIFQRTCFEEFPAQIRISA
jgi:hypothetical protein